MHPELRNRGLVTRLHLFDVTLSESHSTEAKKTLFSVYRWTASNGTRVSCLKKIGCHENFAPLKILVRGPGKSFLHVQNVLGPKFSKIFENFCPCVEKWSAHFEFKGQCTRLLLVVRALVYSTAIKELL